MAGYYEINQSANGQYYFSLKAGNGEIILSSQQYKTKNSAKKGIASVQSNSSLDQRFDEKIAKNGQFFFNLKAANHQIIGTSEMYTSTAGRDKGIASVKKNGSTTVIKDNSIAA